MDESDKFHNQLENISEKIKGFVSLSDPNLMMQQQMMQQQMMQQQMMQQQMLQQQMMQQQAMMDQNMNEKYLNFKFKNSNGSFKAISIKSSKKIKDLFDKYIDEAYGLNSPKKLDFLYNAQKVDRYDQRKVGDYFICGFTIIVVEYN